MSSTQGSHLLFCSYSCLQEQAVSSFCFVSCVERKAWECFGCSRDVCRSAPKHAEASLETDSNLGSLLWGQTSCLVNDDSHRVLRGLEQMRLFYVIKASWQPHPTWIPFWWQRERRRRWVQESRMEAPIMPQNIHNKASAFSTCYWVERAFEICLKTRNATIRNPAGVAGEEIFLSFFHGLVVGTELARTVTRNVVLCACIFLCLFSKAQYQIWPLEGWMSIFLESL